MVAIAIFSADPAMCRSLEQLLREDSALRETLINAAMRPFAA
jgi:hypothetical protein